MSYFHIFFMKTFQKKIKKNEKGQEELKQKLEPL